MLNYFNCSKMISMTSLPGCFFHLTKDGAMTDRSAWIIQKMYFYLRLDSSSGYYLLVSKIHIDCNYKLYFLQAYVKFVMEVEGMPRHIAEEMLFNWTEQLPKLLVQLRKNSLPQLFFLTCNSKIVFYFKIYKKYIQYVLLIKI